MTLLLRKIDKRARWLKDDEAKQLLASGDVPSDPLGDLNTSGNKLSVWTVNSDKSNIDQIASAIASTRQRPADFSFIIFRLEDITSLGIEHENVPGNTQHTLANRWHVDLIKLTGNKLKDLGKALLNKGELDTIPKKRIVGLLNSDLDSNNLPEKLRYQLFGEPTEASGTPPRSSVG